MPIFNFVIFQFPTEKPNSPISASAVSACLSCTACHVTLAVGRVFLWQWPLRIVTLRSVLYSQLSNWISLFRGFNQLPVIMILQSVALLDGASEEPLRQVRRQIERCDTELFQSGQWSLWVGVLKVVLHLRLRLCFAVHVESMSVLPCVPSFLPIITVRYGLVPLQLSCSPFRKWK